MNGLIFVVNLGKYAIRRWYRFVLSMAFSPFHVPFLLGEPPPPHPSTAESRLEAQVGVCKAALEVLQSSRMATRHVTEALK